VPAAVRWGHERLAYPDDQAAARAGLGQTITGGGTPVPGPKATSSRESVPWGAYDTLAARRLTRSAALQALEETPPTTQPMSFEAAGGRPHVGGVADSVTAVGQDLAAGGQKSCQMELTVGV
jgi:hypothetical protein